MTTRRPKPSMAAFSSAPTPTPAPTPTAPANHSATARKNVAFRVTEPQRLALIQAASALGYPSIYALLQAGVAELFAKHGLKDPFQP